MVVHTTRGPQRLSSLSVFFPAYNDAATIAGLIDKADRAARQVSDDYEIIIVNDGSRDDTAAVLERLRETQPCLRVVTHQRNRGYGGALRSGFAAARHEWLFYTDGDGQYDPGELSRLVDSLAPGVDVVNGFKRRRGDSWVRIGLGAIYNTMVRALFGLRIRDVDCDFRLIRRQALDRLTLVSDSGAICVELVRKLQDLGARFAEAPVSHYHRRHGRSQFFTVPRVARTASQLVRLWWTLIRKNRVSVRQHELG